MGSSLSYLYSGFRAISLAGSALVVPRFRVRATKYKGRSLDCSYSLPTYSPRTPMLLSRVPPITQSVTNNEVQPVTVYQPKIWARIARPASTRPNAVTINPMNMLMRSGSVENEVAAVHANESILANEYLL